MLNEVGNVVAKDFRQSSVRPGPCWASDPVRELVGPDEIVAADQFAAGFGKADEVVASSEVVDVLFWFGVHELCEDRLAPEHLQT